MDIARIIREGREKLKLNQSELAELVGVSPQAVQQWESGATQPRGKRLNRIAEVLKLPPAMMHFGMPLEVPAAPDTTVSPQPEKPARGTRATSPRVAEKPVSENDALINQVIEAMRRMSKEDAARLVTISKALVGETSAEVVEAVPSVDLKPLPVPDLPPHPPPAFPPRRMPESRTKVRGKTAIR
ncbi:helix-turn-helix domain-containing protein [Nitrosospira multiformis]|jgi:HTH-type transcriptional regulator, cell division transcriptional repressor|uniref:Transcriptional regulator, XRE family n=1 Tax=Nitrosospira multiformis TaxID=1231 RepID=A0A1I7H0P1_9PROT|nr:helix-turn-helix domain-containing protein [Nitrosospira multiformis]SFU54281.1 transcriptional regulator, XRE family [Nitrosospira multiformis]